MTKSEFVDYYALLEVPADADGTAIKRAYLLAAKKAHPDAGGSTEQMQLLNTAYRTLSDHLKRTAYDKLYTLHTNVATSNLDLKEDGYNHPVSSDEDIIDEDYFVDQLYSEYYEKPKKPVWKPSFRRKKQ